MNRPLRVLTIGHSYVLAVNRSLARAVAEDGDFDVTVAAPSFFHGDFGPIRVEPEPSESKLRLVSIGSRTTKFIHLFGYEGNGLHKLLSEDFDVVHAWEEPFIYAGYQIARSVAKTARFVFRTAQSIVKRYPPPFCFFERAVRRRAQGWIAGGNLVYKAMLQRGYDKDRGRVLTLAVDTSAFKPLASEQRDAVLRDLGLRSPLIGFLGRVTPEKGIDRLLDALELIPRDLDWNLLCIGTGSREGHARQWAEQRGLSGRVKIQAVRHDEVPRYLGACDLLVAPSQTTSRWREQFGRMLIEAFACGVPAITSDSGELPYVADDAARVVSEGDSRAWAVAIAETLTDPARRDTMRQRGFARLNQYSVKTVASQYREYYRWLSAQSPCAV